MISIVIPTYQRFELTQRAAQSALEQTWSGPFEVIIADNGSRDGSLERLEKEFSVEIQKGVLKVLKNPPSGDPGTNRNLGAKLARGEFLAFLDSDDWWDRDRLEKISPRLGTLDYVIEPRGPLSADGDLIRSYLQINLGAMSSIVIRKSLFDQIGGFASPNFGPDRRRFPTYEDYELTLRVLLKVWRTHPERVWARQENSVHTEMFGDGFNRIRLRDQMYREANLLLRLWPKTPIRYWALIARRLLGCCKAMLFNHPRAALKAD